MSDEVAREIRKTRNCAIRFVVISIALCILSILILYVNAVIDTLGL